MKNSDDTLCKYLLSKIKHRVQEAVPQAEVYLYGSRARGDGHMASDWDVLILVDENTLSYGLEKSITYPLYDLEFETGQLISPMVYTKQQWYEQYKTTPFYQKITPELVTV